MSETIKTYQNKQQKMLSLLQKLENFISQGDEFGLNLDPSIRKKLASAINNVQESKLKIALVGGFSEGKTSIAAAWLGKLDRSSMKISAAESSNAVSIYNIDDDCLLIDTPGLYGFKEKINENQEVEKYKEITKKYVSEAHIILYVMNSKNPIKESHRDDLIWLFRDLDLLSRTVFVLSRFDEVADVEDERDYEYHLKIKQDNVKNRLQDILNLSQDESDKLLIIAVSANPFEEGIEYWLENPEEFRKLSHIGLLQQATKDIIQYNGGLETIANEAKKSIYNDVMLREMPLLEKENAEIARVVSEISDLCLNKKYELDLLTHNIQRARDGLRNSINGYFEDLIIQIQGSSLDTIGDLLVREIGDDGYRVTDQINSIFQRETNTISNALNQQILTFDMELDNVDSTISLMAGKGIRNVIKNVKFDNKMVLAARDGINSVVKSLGGDLSKLLKFKPHGAAKFAKGLNNAAAFIGIALELYDSYEQQEKQNKFVNAKKQLCSNLTEQHKQILALINSDDFIPMFFQGYLELLNAFQELEYTKNQQEEHSKKFNEWKYQGEIIDAEFKTIN